MSVFVRPYSLESTSLSHILFLWDVFCYFFSYLIVSVWIRNIQHISLFHRLYVPHQRKHTSTRPSRASANLSILCVNPAHLLLVIGGFLIHRMLWLPSIFRQEWEPFFRSGTISAECSAALSIVTILLCTVTRKDHVAACCVADQALIFFPPRPQLSRTCQFPSTLGYSTDEALPLSIQRCFTFTSILSQSQIVQNC